MSWGVSGDAGSSLEDLQLAVSLPKSFREGFVDVHVACTPEQPALRLHFKGVNPLEPPCRSRADAGCCRLRKTARQCWMRAL